MHQLVGPADLYSIEEAAKIPELSEETRALLTSSKVKTIQELPRRLMELGAYKDTLLLLPHLLPLRAGVWWGCLCAWHACGAEPEKIEEQALGASVYWVYQPTRAMSRSLGAAWRADRFKTPAGLCARAAELSGWIEQDAFHVTNLLGAVKTLTGAVKKSLSRAKARGIACSEKQLAAFGIDVAEGRVPWV